MSGVDKLRTSTSESSGGSGPISVEIRGQKLTIRSEKDHAFVESLAAYVDGKVAELQAGAPAAPFEKLLMLASMTVAGELFEAQRELQELRGEVKQRAEALSELLDTLEKA